MTKQLRLASAALTDIGRRRERNQDNVTSHVPPDPELFAEKGALFVVCDGMGGHAAGEVASDLGVHTIENVYFAQRGMDVISSIAQAVKSANDEIYSTARATVEYGGMGTTCVALVIAGGRAYIVNIGDSRAYILRDGQVRQVTQDHSWVAEQVRGGVLSEEQARVHAHRNVITRSLGTQPNITADLFVETLHDGDRVLLCSDGLHGYVEEAAIYEELKTQPDADKAVHKLVDMANSNGGPDNITAVVVDVLETPEVTEPIPLPPNATAAIEEGETQPLPVPPGVAATTPAAAVKAAPATKPTKEPKRRARRSGAGVVVLRVLEIAALLLIGFSAWYVGLGPLAAQRAADQRTQRALIQAQTATRDAPSQNPTDALRSLASARASLLATFSDPALESSVKAQAQGFLDVPFASAVQGAIQRYNSAATITRLTLAINVNYQVNCTSPGIPNPSTLSALTSLVAISAPTGKPAIQAGAQLLYAVSGGSLYQIAIGVDAQGIPEAPAFTCQQAPLAGISQVLALAPNGGAAAVALVSTSKGYSVVGISPVPGKGSVPGVKVQPLVTPPTTNTPGAVLENGSTVYVAFSGGATGVWQFTIPPPPAPTAKGPPPPPPAPKVIATPQPVTSMRLAGGSVFLSLADGSLGQIDATGAFQPVSVLAPQPVTTADPSSYTAAMAVPQPPSNATPGASGGAAFGPNSTLVNDPLNPAQLLLADVSVHRIVRLTANTSGPGAGLSGQYVYDSSVPTFTMLAIGSAGSNLVLYGWDGAQLTAFPVAEPAAG